MCATDRACDRYLHKAFAQAYTLWDAAARMVDAARQHSVAVSLRRHREEHREKQQRLREQEGRAEQDRCEAMKRRQVTRKLVTERRRRKHEAADKRQTDAHRVAVATRQETWERGRTLAPSARSRQRRCHPHRGKGARPIDMAHGWLDERRNGRMEGTAAVLVAAERLLAHAVFASDRGAEG